MPTNPATKNIQPEKPVQLLVEGNDMKNFFEALSNNGMNSFRDMQGPVPRWA